MDIPELFVERSRYYLGQEYRTKLRRAVEALPPDAIWRRTSPEANSAGNLLLHLTGNVRQWIVSGVGGIPGERNRAAEFAAREGAGAGDLLAGLETVLDEADAVLARLTATDLLDKRNFQGRHVSVLEAVYHVVEHFAMHTGQIILLAKQYAPGSVKFYEDAGGLARPVWQAKP